jgi:hypothetical protein
MYLVITHLTRMQPGSICVAGIDPDTGRQIRPVIGRCFTRDFLYQNGGPFQIAAAVDLGQTTYVGHAPEYEDHRIDPNSLRYLGRLTADDFWSVLRKTSKHHLAGTFGTALQHDSKTHSSTTAENTGAASLGHLCPTCPADISVNHWGKLRAVIHDQTSEPEISVTDIRLCRFDHQTPRLKLVADISDRLQSVPAILAVGLTRPFQKSDDAPTRHWLQLNNIHLQDDPLGELLPPADDDEEPWSTGVCAPCALPPNLPIPKPPQPSLASEKGARKVLIFQRRA